MSILKQIDRKLLASVIVKLQVPIYQVFSEYCRTSQITFICKSKEIGV